MPDWLSDLLFGFLSLSLFVHASMVVAYAHKRDVALTVAALSGFTAAFMAITKVIAGATWAPGLLAGVSGMYLFAVVKSRLNDKRHDADP